MRIDSHLIFSQADRASGAPLRALWCASAVLAVGIAAMAGTEVARFAGHPGAPLTMGHDLLPSYTAGLLVRQGRDAGMYDAARFQEAERRVMQEANLAGDPRLAPFVNPPFFAWLFAPLSALPYRMAAVVFLVLSLGLFATSMAMLCRMLPREVDWRGWGLVPLIAATSIPFWQAITHLQNTFLSLAILTMTVRLWRARRGVAAGAVAGLLLFKPQLAAVVALGLVATLGWRAIAGLTASGAALAMVTVLAMPGAILSFLRDVPPAVHHLQFDLPYNWGRQVTLQSFWRLLVQGHGRGPTAAVVTLLWLASAATLAGLLGWMLLRNRSTTARAGCAEREIVDDELIAALLVSMPLLMPYYMDYDLLLLVVPAVLHAGARAKMGRRRLDREILMAWAALFVVTIVNPFLTDATRLNGTVLVLAALAGLSLTRCLGRRGTTGTMSPEAGASLALAA